VRIYGLQFTKSCTSTSRASSVGGNGSMLCEGPVYSLQFSFHHISSSTGCQFLPTRLSFPVLLFFHFSCPSTISPWGVARGKSHPSPAACLTHIACPGASVFVVEGYLTRPGCTNMSYLAARFRALFSLLGEDLRASICEVPQILVRGGNEFYCC